MLKIDLNYFPGWTRKSMTFTIDDGNITLDKKFISYIQPGGFKGTFNLTTPLHYQAPKSEQHDFYRSLYEGYEIGNHCRYHAYPFTPDRTVIMKNELFNQEVAEREYGYLTDEEGLYRIFTYDWTYLADNEKFMECVDSCQKELGEIFGKGKIKGFIWPCGEQKNSVVFQKLKAYGFQSIRITGCLKDSNGFALPPDRMRWSYNADWSNFTEAGRLYEQYPDDGTLKFFCFGVHSHDFENNNCWEVLKGFVDNYGNRPETFWYASVGDIMDYDDSVKKVIINDKEIQNPSDIDLFIKINGKRAMLHKNSSIILA